MNSPIKMVATMMIVGGLSQAAFADESSVSSTSSNGAGTSTDKVRATSGPDGAKVSHTKTNVQANGDGSVSATKQHVSHTLGADGSAATHRSASSTTVNPDGSSSTASTSQHKISE
jgi:regulatory protein YycH of two-component signal transduction system YycFG